MAKKTFHVNGTLSAGSYMTLTPALGEVWIVGEIETNITDFWVVQSYHGYGAADVISGRNSYGGRLQKELLVAKNGSGYHVGTSGGSGGGPNNDDCALRFKALFNSFAYRISGDVTTLADEGMSDLFAAIVQESLTGYTYDYLPPTAGKAFLVCVVNATGDGNKFDIIDTETGAVLGNLLSAGSTSTGQSRFQPFWIWPDSGFKLRFSTVSGTTVGSGYVRGIVYDTATLPDHADRLSVKLDIAAQSYYDLQPPPGEIWYVDWHNWNDGNIYPNGGATPLQMINTAKRLRADNENWFRFKNNNSAGGASMRLAITGTKAKV